MDVFINVANQKLRSATNQRTFVAGTQEYIRFVFALPEDWLPLSAFVQFQQNNKSYNVYLDEDNAAYMPPEIHDGEMTIALQGNLNNTIAKTSTLTFEISADPIISDSESTLITLSLYDQLAGSLAGIEVDMDSLDARIVALEDNEVVLQEIHETVETTLAEYLVDGEFANMIIGDGTISRNKIDEEFEADIKKLENGLAAVSTLDERVGANETDIAALDDSLSALWQSVEGYNTNAFCSSVTSFSSDGKIVTETYGTKRLETEFVSESEVVQRLYENDTLSLTKTITFNADGSIKEEVEKNELG